MKTDEATRFSGWEAIASLREQGWGGGWNVGSGHRHLHLDTDPSLGPFSPSRMAGHPSAPGSPGTSQPNRQRRGRDVLGGGLAFTR